ncbi:hypothetical protein ABBQ32_013427 [Trebouxia sp. C0010 RCD-2024]
MGKHNGKARSSGTKVGTALVNNARKGGKGGKVGAIDEFRHTTDAQGAPNMQSVIENNDLTELLTMADLAGKDFTAEKQQVIVISAGNNKALTAKDQERNALERCAAEQRHQHRLTIPRRPEWNTDMAPEILEQRERASFLEWRRDLAKLEDEEGLVLTPFEKNLEVWRQLWRVLERSDIVVQVLDARDPLRYRSEDLEAYSLDLHPTKGSVLLLNKADLLPAALRSAWADYFEGQGVEYVFWSAKAGIDSLTAPGPVLRHNDTDDARAKVLNCEELMHHLHQRAQAAVNSRVDAEEHQRHADHGRVTVGLTGYPNVGKSSTINALFGSKKTAVAPTPGKTKHFQTLNITDGLTLCDCPGLVLPRYAQSKSEMVAAGVIPIDRLTDVRTPVAVVCERIPRPEFERVYGLKLPNPDEHDAPDKVLKAAELLRSYALSRGWVAASGLPDETRSGRQVLKDFVNGKLLHCERPPACSLSNLQLGLTGQNATASKHAASAQTQDAPDTAAHQADAQTNGDSHAQSEGASDSASEAGQSSDQDAHHANSSQEGNARADDAAAGSSSSDTEAAAAAHWGRLTDADRELIESMSAVQVSERKPKRPEYKFQKKPARTKGNRGKADDGNTAYDGQAFTTGRRGGLVRVPVTKA